mmetsp:Transcript_34015/g.49402  ORF Transcript_34015/g.49402 Transcript_34015/m.49402 type:complete len:138 (+) Transcript_34015:80-493(+)
MQRESVKPSYSRSIVNGNAKCRTGAMYTMKTGKREITKVQSNKRKAVDLKQLKKIIVAGSEKKEDPFALYNESFSKFAKTNEREPEDGMKFTIPNVQTNMNIVEQGYSRTHHNHQVVLEDLKAKFSDDDDVHEFKEL